MSRRCSKMEVFVGKSESCENSWFFFQLWAKCSVFSSACWQPNLQRCKCAKQKCFDWGRQVAAGGLPWPCFHPVGLCQQTLANSNLPFKNGDYLTCKHQNLWTFHLPSSSKGCFTFTAIKTVLRAKQIYCNRKETQKSDWQTCCYLLLA